MTSAAKYQEQLLDQARKIYARTPISEPAAQAFLETPRHRFVRRYRERGVKDWTQITPDNLSEHLPKLYEDHPLTLWGDDDDHVSSTISQPSFVLRMLDLLQIEPGHKVLELGTGSGWNAALLGRLVGPRGTVFSVEIIPELAKQAAETLSDAGITNVRVVEGDGGDGYAPGAPYDRITFTAGTYDLPRHFYEQIKPGGLLLAVIKNPGGGDNLFILEKKPEYFQSIDSMQCGFVQLAGKYKLDSLDPLPLDALPEWHDLQHQEIGRRAFWWGGKGREWFVWQTAAIRSFLGLTDPTFRTFKDAKPSAGMMDGQYFGLWDRHSMSLVIADNDELISYGNATATDRLLQAVHHWVDLGMPSGASFTLRVYRNDRELPASERGWIVRRQESQFLWTLEKG